MDTSDPIGTDWTEGEIDFIVADYFEMLQLERAGEPYVKAERNRALQETTRRSRGSIEFKHQNISAVLYELGLDWIPGYKPMANYQRALISGIERYLDRKVEILVAPLPLLAPGAAEDNGLFFEPPPSPIANPVNDVALLRLIRKFDAAARDARNRALGKRGEEKVFLSERARLNGEGRQDLSRKVRWVSEEDGDGAGYDILSFDAAGTERLLEVKTTVGSQTTPFFLSENERLVQWSSPINFELFVFTSSTVIPRLSNLLHP